MKNKPTFMSAYEVHAVRLARRHESDQAARAFCRRHSVQAVLQAFRSFGIQRPDQEVGVIARAAQIDVLVRGLDVVIALIIHDSDSVL